MRLIDTHTHLFLPEFNDDRDQVVENAKQNGVEKVILPNVDSTTIQDLENMVRKYPDFCYPLMGLHPTSVKENFENELELVANYIAQNKVYGIGEIGIDLYWDKTFQQQQERAFRYQINLAKQNSLPIVIHARDSFDEIFKIMHQEIDENLKGIFHAFTGSSKQAKQIQEWGFYIGIGGIVTFKNAGLDQVVNTIDISHVVLETDSPYLAPVPKRGKRNESAYLKYIAEKIAEIKGLSIDDVAEITTNNAKKVFNI
jgi:TatD DNase family protein